MRMVEQVLRPRDRREGDVGLEAHLLERRLGIGLEHLGDLRHQPRPRLDAQVVGGELRVGRQLGLLEEFAEALPLAVAGDADKDLQIVGRVEDLVDRPRAHALRHRRRRGTIDRGDREMLAHQEHDRFEQRALDQPALPGPLALLQRQHRTERAKHSADDVDHRGTGTQRPAAGAGHIGETAHHLHDLIERRPLLVGPGQEALQCAIDEARVDLLQVRRPKLALGHRTWREILDQHIGLFEQLHQDLTALGRIGIERQALLVAIEVAEEAGAEAAQLARAVAVDRLDLDHLGPEVGQDHAAGRPQDRVGEFDDADALEGRFKR